MTIDAFKLAFSIRLSIIDASISHNFLRVWTEEVRRWWNLCGVDLCIWKLGNMCHNDFFLHCKELIEAQSFLSLQFSYDLVIGLRLLQAFPVLVRADLSSLRLIRLENLPHHHDLFLVESLIEVFLHFEVGIDSCLLWLAGTHVRWLIKLIWMNINWMYHSLNPSGNWKSPSGMIGPFWFGS